MKKKEYVQPTMDVVEVNMNAQILAGSVTSVTTTGLDDDNLELDGVGDLENALAPELNILGF